MSVSRDRRWSLYQKQESSYQLIDQSPLKGNTHSRIIWTCDWSHDTKYFVTGSRDCKAILWKRNDSQKDIKYEASAVSALSNQSITAITFYPGFINNETSKYLVAVGFENGVIQLYFVTDSEWNLVYKIEDWLVHLSLLFLMRLF